MGTRLFIIFLGISFFIPLCSTIAIFIETCTKIETTCGNESQCNAICYFPGLNAAGDVVKLDTLFFAKKRDLDNVEIVTSLEVIFRKKTWQEEISFIPTQGFKAGKPISLLFYNVDVGNSQEVAGLPVKIQESIKQQQEKNTTIRYALFMLKKVRDGLWQEIGEVYLSALSPDKSLIPLELYPDGNVQVTVPMESGARESIYIRIDQML